MPPAERFLAPIAVLGLHLLLLANVAAHRQHLLQEATRWPAVAEWLLAMSAMLAYIRTVCCDPGFLSPGVRRSRQPSPLCAVWALCCCCWRPSAQRDVRQTYMDTELQPIGWQIEEDMEDPGEEIISLEELSKDTVPPDAEGLSPRRVERSTSTVAQAPPQHPPLPAGQAPSHAQRAQFQSKAAGKLRFCKVCQMHQPLRTKHCRDCGRCVRTHDHHCPWVGTCVGEGNRVYFFWFLVLQWLELLVFTLESGAFFAQDGFAPNLWLGRGPLLVVGTFVKAMLLIMVTCLVSFHSYLAMANITTWENISWYNISYLKSLSPEDGSPFSQSIRMNLALYCCGECWEVGKQEDGWALWELGEQHNPFECQCCNYFAFHDVE